jgi:acetyl-CoA carboxylase biotin carboxylase subunit
MKLRRILIANRGEIAGRIIRSCRKLGIETVLAASEADLDSVPARLADITVCIGSSRAAQSYLDVERVLAAAKATKADAIHPGYGFLSENALLARACKSAGIVFIGPEETHLANLGDKLRARQHALAAGLPVVPGAQVDNVEAALALAGDIGFPVLIKAVAGGGGRGMKRINNESEMAPAMALAMAEAEASFGDPRIYVERFVEHGRHIEVQLLGDGRGNIIHLGERDCSIQRRYQKLIEEAPAPGLDAALRSAIHAAAVRFGTHLEYKSAGTVEFLVDEERNEFYFLEMNARIQVEHPVTEAITGLDLVAEQIAIEESGRIGLHQDAVRFSGHAVECRINAEDPSNDFQPSPGTVCTALLPAGAGVRVDTHIEPGARVPPFYDSLLAKIVAYGTNREEALARMQLALRNCTIEGVSTSIAIHAEIMRDEAFKAGGVTTSFLPAFLSRTHNAFSRKVDQT